jgi:hypothetical protein
VDPTCKLKKRTINKLKKIMNEYIYKLSHSYFEIIILTLKFHTKKTLPRGNGFRLVHLKIKYNPFETFFEFCGARHFLMLTKLNIVAFRDIHRNIYTLNRNLDKGIGYNFQGKRKNVCY